MRKIPKIIFLALVIVATVSASNMTPEEVAVRSLYAKLAYAAQLFEVHEAMQKNKQLTLSELEAQLNQSQVRFQITGLSSGPLSQILETKYSDLVTKPDGSDVLGVGPGTLKYKEDLSDGSTNETQEINAQLIWTSGQILTEDWNFPFAKVLNLMSNASDFKRYAAFTVTVDYLGKTRTYKAVFLFGTDKDGNLEIWPIDTVTNNPALHFFAKEDVYPTTFLDTSLRQKRVVSDWLTAHQLDNLKCQSGKKKVCCDPDTMQCGVSAGDVQSALAK
jgi:hypothetical protein